MSLPAMILEEHLEEARGLIKHFGMNTHEKNWSRNPDCLDIVARNMMNAHYNFDESLGFQRSTYVVNAGKWGICKYRHMMAKAKNISLYCHEINDSVCDPINDDLDTDFDGINSLAKVILNHKKLEKKERLYLKLYYIKGIIMTDISKKLGIYKQKISKM